MEWQEVVLSGVKWSPSGFKHIVRSDVEGFRIVRRFLSGMEWF